MYINQQQKFRELTLEKFLWEKLESLKFLKSWQAAISKSIALKYEHTTQVAYIAWDEFSKFSMVVGDQQDFHLFTTSATTYNNY